MKLPRFSILRLSIALAILALDMAVIRSLLRTAPGSNSLAYQVPIDATHAMSFLTFALGVLPMASLLVPALIAQAWTYRRTGAASAAWLGFTASGWVAVFLYMCLACLSPDAIHWYVGQVGAIVATPFRAVLDGSEPDWIFEAIECAIVLGALGLPQLAVALAGGLLVSRPGRGSSGLPGRAAGPRQALGAAGTSIGGVGFHWPSRLRPAARPRTSA
ncbi:MAG: hypothetical protein U0794_00550 [Isosphaeraceae bacterium]